MFFLRVFFAVFFCHIVRYFSIPGRKMSDTVFIPTKNIGKERGKAVRILSDIMGKGGLHGDYFISYDTLIPIIEGLRPPKPRKNPCASAWKHQKDRAENPLFHRKTGKTHGILHTQSRNKSQPEVMRTTSIFRKKRLCP